MIDDHVEVGWTGHCAATRPLN